MGTTIEGGGNLWRVTMAGSMGSEIFSYGWWVSGATGLTAAELLTAVATAHDIFLASAVTAFGSVKALFASEIVWDTITVRPYNASTGVPTAMPTSAAYSAAGTGGQSLPYQCSVVVTLWNGRTMGKRRYNRFYTPPMVITVCTSHGQLEFTVATDLCTAFKAMDDSLLGNSPHAISSNYFSNVGHDVQGLDEVRVDDVIDTQRRRRNQLVPSVASLALT
jgi:hypothetical protein